MNNRAFNTGERYRSYRGTAKVKSTMTAVGDFSKENEFRWGGEDFREDIPRQQMELRLLETCKNLFWEMYLRGILEDGNSWL